MRKKKSESKEEKIPESKVRQGYYYDTATGEYVPLGDMTVSPIDPDYEEPEDGHDTQYE